MGVFDIAICTIFAREVLEGTVIIGQYRTVIQKSPDFEDEVRKADSLKAVNQAALIASAVAIVMIIIVAIPLAIAGKDLDERVVEIIEGVSKVVASICIIGLSLKVPKWLGVYASKKTNEEGIVEGMTIKSIRFNVAWNIWREVAECGAFLIPFFLGGGAEAIPLSAAIGILVGGLAGAGIYFGSRNMQDKFWLAFFLSALTGMLAVGLFVGGCHEFEEVWGETRKVWKIETEFWSHKKLPMAIFKPFGYSASRTVLQICCFWLSLATLLGLHYWKWTQSKKIRAARALQAKELGEDKFEDDV